MNLLEKRVLDAFAKSHSNSVANLSAQTATITVVVREETGVGSYTYFTSDRSPASTYTGALIGIATGPDENAAVIGFVLFLINGMIDCLECFSYTSDWPVEREQFIVFEA
ncbi:MAG: hypothetical protein AAFX02_09755 [Pseudomonadota bacterium]